MQKKLKSLRRVLRNPQIVTKVLDFKKTKWKRLQYYLKKQLKKSRFFRKWFASRNFEDGFFLLHRCPLRSEQKFAIKREDDAFKRFQRPRYGPALANARKLKHSPRAYAAHWIKKKKVIKLKWKFGSSLKIRNSFKYVYKLHDYRPFLTSKNSDFKHIQFYSTPLYKKKNLLYLLRLFRTFPIVTKYFDKKNAFVNGTVSKTNDGLLKGGDVLFLKKPIELRRSDMRTRPVKASICTHLEYDIYSQHFCVVKDLSELSKNDLNLSTIYKLKMK